MADEKRPISDFSKTSTLVDADFFTILHAGLNQVITKADMLKQIFASVFTNDTDFPIAANATTAANRSVTFRLSASTYVRLLWDNANSRFTLVDQTGKVLGLYFRDLARVGVVEEYTGTVVPFGAVWANGQALNRINYADLFAKNGTRYGAGDGSTTFNVINKMGRVSIGTEGMGGASPSGRMLASSAATLGGSGGSETRILTVDNLPAHSHDTTVFSSSGTGIASNGSSNGNLPTLTGETGNGQPFNNCMPYISSNYIVWF